MKWWKRHLDINKCKTFLFYIDFKTPIKANVNACVKYMFCPMYYVVLIANNRGHLAIMGYVFTGRPCEGKFTLLETKIVTIHNESKLVKYSFLRTIDTWLGVWIFNFWNHCMLIMFMLFIFQMGNQVVHVFLNVMFYLCVCVIKL